MNNYFVRLSDSYTLPIIGGVTLSTGDGLETKQRYGYDYSRRPQSLIYRKRNTALNASIQMAFNAAMCREYTKDIMEYISELETICADRVSLVWNDRQYGEFVITQVQFSAQCDPLVLFPQMNVSLALTEGYVRHETLYTQVGTLVKG